MVGLHHAGRPGWRNTGVGGDCFRMLRPDGRDVKTMLAKMAGRIFGDRDTWEGNPRLAGSQEVSPDR